MTVHLHRNHLLHQRSKRVCATPGCLEKPEPKDRYCLKCQLEGKAPDEVKRAPG